ncbi:MAG: hypothetical protein M0R33_06375 [Methylomonas sp.]|jgi:hypothetical protein|uniref:hypothetical protein n=1 Tax=Methylomonas sp. TaxID=418 RepID=UPI0025DF9AB0|nr:hypothetical protein [Methylomonas sp.]MCK9606063.1 hypothetical protein [Methylomonas sp.]
MAISVAIRSRVTADDYLGGELSPEIKRELIQSEIFAKWGVGINRDRLVGLQQQVVADAG